MMHFLQSYSCPPPQAGEGSCGSPIFRNLLCFSYDHGKCSYVQSRIGIQI